MISSPLQTLVHRLRKKKSRTSRLTLKDRVLAHRLLRTFERDMELAQVRGIHFYARNGTVTLYGTIRHELDRNLLVSLVRQITGVKAVVEHLQIVDTPFQDTEAELVMHL